MNSLPRTSRTILNKTFNPHARPTHLDIHARAAAADIEKDFGLAKELLTQADGSSVDKMARSGDISVDSWNGGRGRSLLDRITLDAPDNTTWTGSLDSAGLKVSRVSRDQVHTDHYGKRDRITRTTLQESGGVRTATEHVYYPNSILPGEHTRESRLVSNPDGTLTVVITETERAFL